MGVIQDRGKEGGSGETNRNVVLRELQPIVPGEVRVPGGTCCSGRLDIKPFSVNKAYKGRKFKTDAYKAFEKECLYRLPKTLIPAPPYKLTLWFTFSNARQDIDNTIKPFQDILQKRYGFNDKDIAELHVYKKVGASPSISFALSTAE